MNGQNFIHSQNGHVIKYRSRPCLINHTQMFMAFNKAVNTCQQTETRALYLSLFNTLHVLQEWMRCANSLWLKGDKRCRGNMTLVVNGCKGYNRVICGDDLLLLNSLLKCHNDLLLFLWLFENRKRWFNLLTT